MNPIYAAQTAADDALSSEGVAADFSAETWWLTLIKAGFITAFLIVSVMMALWVERRSLARVRTCLGPNVNGPLNLLQAVADADKLIMKKSFQLKGAEKVIYLLAPLIAASSAFMVYAVIPFGSQVSIFGHSTPLQPINFPVVILYILAITAFGVYGIILGGWSMHSTYPLFGAVHNVARVISYELSISLSILAVFLTPGTMSTLGIVTVQEHIWWAVAMVFSFIVYVISMIDEVNCLPFDLSRTEGELIVGRMAEYSLMKSAWYFLAGYIDMFDVSTVYTTPPLDGWHSAVLGLFWEDANSGWWPMLWFVTKVWTVMFFMTWIRRTLVRIRYDHFMKLGWKVFVPILLVWFMLVTVMCTFRTFSGAFVQALLLPTAVVFCVIMFTLFLISDREEEEELCENYEDDDEDADDEDVEILDAEDDHITFLEGFSIPPPPDTLLPPPPHAHRAALAAQTTNMAGDSETGTVTAVGLLGDTDVEDDDPTGSADSIASTESPDSVGTAGTVTPAGTDTAIALPTFTLDLKADPASGKDTDTTVEASQEGKDD